MGQMLGQNFTPYVPNALQALGAVIQAPNARDDEYVTATENAVSALGRLCEHQTQNIDAKAIFPSFLACLPLTEDAIESRAVNAQLARLLQNDTYKTYLLGENYEHLARLILIFAEVMPTVSSSEKVRLCEPETAAQFKELLVKLQSTLPGETLAAAFGTLAAEKQQALQRAMSS
jgi:importin-5